MDNDRHPENTTGDTSKTTMTAGFADRLYQWRIPIIAVFVITVLIAAIALFLTVYQDSQSAIIADEAYEISLFIEQWREEIDTEAKEEKLLTIEQALEDFALKYPDSAITAATRMLVAKLFFSEVAASAAADTGDTAESSEESAANVDTEELEKEALAKAAKLFNEVIASGQDTFHKPAAHFFLAVIAEKENDLGASLINMQKVIEYDGFESIDYPRAYFNLARLHELNGQRQEAVDNYKNLIEKFPNSNWGLLARSRLIDIEAFETLN